MKTMGYGLPADLLLAWGKFGWASFVQVLDYSNFNSVDHCLK